MMLSGHFSGTNFNHYQGSYLSYYFIGYYPSSFGVVWYRGPRWGESQNDSGASTADKLNMSISVDTNRRDFHLYNRTAVPTHFVGDFTYSFDL